MLMLYGPNDPETARFPILFLCGTPGIGLRRGDRLARPALAPQYFQSPNAAALVALGARTMRCRDLSAAISRFYTNTISSMDFGSQLTAGNPPHRLCRRW